MLLDDEVLTGKEAAAYWKLHPKTVYRLPNQGKIPAQRVGGTWRLYRERLRYGLQTAGQTAGTSSESRGENEPS